MAWGLRCSFYDMGKFEGLDRGTGNNEGSTLSILMTNTFVVL